MARIHHVKKSSAVHKCSFNGHEIPKGSPYTWAKPGFRTRRPIRRCLDHPFKESDLITGQRAEIVAARESAIDAIDAADNIEEVESAMQEFESAADEYVSTRQDALDAWPNGNSTLEDYVYQAEAIQSEVSGWSADYADGDEPDESEVEAEADLAKERGEDFNGEDYITAWQEERLEEVKDAARDVLESLDV